MIDELTVHVRERRVPRLWPRRGSLVGFTVGIAALSGTCLAYAEQAARGPAGWFSDGMVWAHSPVDLSFLNADDRPAGRHGRIRAQEGVLVRGDGRPIRLWGTNLSAYSLYGADLDEVRTQARRLAALGFNLVRLHHHDSDWVDPNVFEPGPTTRKLRVAALKDIDTWIEELNQVGIYVWLDLHVGRRFRAQDDITAFAEVKGDLGSSGLAFVNPSIEARMHEFARAYLGRARTSGPGLVQDNPGLFAVLVSNEDDLNTHFGPRMYPGGALPWHARRFSEAVTRVRSALGLSGVQAQDTWAPGPGKMILATIEAEFYGRALANLRRLGVGALVAVGSFWGAEPLYALPPLALGDVVDVHSYGSAGELGYDPRTTPSFLDWIAAARVAGRPLTVTEWSVPLEHADRFTAPVRAAAVAALQSWDALMLYAYMQMPIGAVHYADSWSAGIDPGLLALMPAAALIFRRGDVQPARRMFAIRPNRETLYFQARSPENSRALRTLTEQSRVEIVLPDVSELGWDVPGPSVSAATLVTDLDQDFLAPGAQVIRSDTGELVRNPEQSLYTVDTPRTQAVAGRLGGRTVRLSSLEVVIETPQAALALSALDGGQPIEKAARLLLSAVARVEPSSGGQLPFWSEPVVGTVALRVSKGMRLFPLAPDGSARSPLPADWRDGWLRVRLPGVPAHHYLVAPVAPRSSADGSEVGSAATAPGASPASAGARRRPSAGERTKVRASKRR